jgi:hypothetical protein
VKSRKYDFPLTHASINSFNVSTFINLLGICFLKEEEKIISAFFLHSCCQFLEVMTDVIMILKS